MNNAFRHCAEKRGEHFIQRVLALFSHASSSLGFDSAILVGWPLVTGSQWRLLSASFATTTNSTHPHSGGPSCWPGAGSVVCCRQNQHASPSVHHHPCIVCFVSNRAEFRGTSDYSAKFDAPVTPSLLLPPLLPAMASRTSKQSVVATRYKCVYCPGFTLTLLWLVEMNAKGVIRPLKAVAVAVCWCKWRQSGCKKLANVRGYAGTTTRENYMDVWLSYSPWSRFPTYTKPAAIWWQRMRWV